MPKRNCDIESADDFRRYYEGWIGLNVAGEVTPGVPLTIPLRYHGHDGQGRLNFYHLTQTKEVTDAKKFLLDDGKYIFTWKEAQEQISFGCPPVGMIQNFEEVLYGAAL